MILFADMLSHLIILLDDSSLPYCNYTNPNSTPRLISFDDLKAGINYAFKENLSVLVVYPPYRIPDNYEVILSEIDHTNVTDYNNVGEIKVIDWKDKSSVKDSICILQTTKDDFFRFYRDIPSIIESSKRLNIFFTDADSFSEEDFVSYQKCLNEIADWLVRLFDEGYQPQFNLITDRLYLNHMNNCGAGKTSIVLAPDGKFYICPAFYYNGEVSVGDVHNGLCVRNAYLFDIQHAPICLNCDAYHCRRCIWLNYKTTQEVNTPSHEQCVISHVEREASRQLLTQLKPLSKSIFKDVTIEQLDYSDPFEQIKKKRV